MQRLLRHKDYLFNGKINIFQPIDGYKVSTDAIFLASTVRCDSKNMVKVMDVGCGIGGISLCLATRLPELKISGIDIQNDGIEIFKQNIIENNLKDKIVDVINGDIFAENKSYYNSFDQVVTNPPYYDSDSQAISKNVNRAKAHHFIKESNMLSTQNNTWNNNSDEARAGNNVNVEKNQGDILNDWISQCLKLVRPRGYFHIVHRAEKLDFILQSIKNKKCGDVKVIPLFPRENSVKASRCIVSCRKGIQGGTTIFRGIPIHKNNSQEYTPVAYNILKNGVGFYD